MKIITRFEELNEVINQEVLVEGILLMKKFVNKANKTLDFYEFWLEMDNKNLVKVKNVGQAMSKEPFTHKVRLKTTVFFGNIDSSDPNVQSRVGYRLDFTEVEIIQRL